MGVPRGGIHEQVYPPPVATGATALLSSPAEASPLLKLLLGADMLKPYRLPLHFRGQGCAVVRQVAEGPSAWHHCITKASLLTEILLKRASLFSTDSSHFSSHKAQIQVPKAGPSTRTHLPCVPYRPPQSFFFILVTFDFHETECTKIDASMADRGVCLDLSDCFRLQVCVYACRCRGQGEQDPLAWPPRWST